MNRPVCPGPDLRYKDRILSGFYRDPRGAIYKVILLAYHRRTHGIQVVYQSLETMDLFVDSAEEFCGSSIYGGRIQRNFTYLGKNVQIQNI
jgi:hypothetical protein